MHDILDNPNEKPAQRWFENLWFVAFSFLLVCIGLVFKVMHWPGAALIILAGFMAIIFRSISLFLQRKRYLYEWFYIAGNLAGIAYLLIRFFNWYTGVFNMILVALFVAGYCAQFFEWPKFPVSSADENADDTDDY
jgi:hypothetical protein